MDSKFEKIKVLESSNTKNDLDIKSRQMGVDRKTVRAALLDG